MAIKLSKKTGLIMSKVNYGIIGTLDVNSVTTRGDVSKNGRPYHYTELALKTFDGHNIKMTAGGFAMDNMYVYDREKNITDVLKYKEGFQTTKKGKLLIGTKYSIGDKIGTFVDIDFSKRSKELLVSGDYKIYGEVEFRKYTSKEGSPRMDKNLKISNVDKIDTTDTKEELHHFDVKNFLFVEATEEGIGGYILGYSNIIYMKFEVGDKRLLKTIMNPKMLKPWTLMTVYGEIKNKVEVVDATPETGAWGSMDSSYGMAVSFSMMEFIVLKIDPASLNHGFITEQQVTEAIAKLKEVQNKFDGKTVEVAKDWGGDNKMPELKADQTTVVEPIEEKKVEPKKDVEVKTKEDKEKDFFDQDEEWGE